jgi:very-short-patch-repair endonuclease
LRPGPARRCGEIRPRRAFERDRERDAILARAGYRTLGFTHRQLTRGPTLVAETIRSSA